MKKKIAKIALWIVSILIGLVILIFIAFNVSPKPGAILINQMFDSPITITDKSTFEKAESNVELLSNKVYKSNYKDHVFDVYYPKNTQKPLPVLIWVHGGGFVGGDKSGVKEFATKLASDANIAVVSMNYELAPNSQYPNQLLQLGELVTELQSKQLDMLDMSKLFFGGDSAGAQIALQYVATQTNREYATEMGINKLLNESEIKGTISYCGPVNLKQTVEVRSTNRFMKFFVNTVAWSLIGTKNWKTSPELFQASIVDYITPEFPPTYITDGNAYSFQEQGMSLENKLFELNIPVKGLFYKNNKKVITHEYQFDYSLKEAKICYNQTLNFINSYQ